MFVQSDLFTHHSGNLSFYGQESKDFTYRLCRMNLFIHGIRGDIRLGNSYSDDKHGDLRADYILANPPFNDGAKGENGWGADKIPDKDPRVAVGGEPMPLSARNANTMWIMHFLHHLRDVSPDRPAAAGQGDAGPAGVRTGDDGPEDRVLPVRHGESAARDGSGPRGDSRPFP